MRKADSPGCCFPRKRVRKRERLEWAIVRPVQQATFLKHALKDGESVVFPGGRKRFASEQKTAGLIGDDEGITVLTIARQELAFVIGAPQFIGALS